MCRDHRCLSTCDKPHRQNEPAGKEDIPTGVEICVMGLLDMCRDHGQYCLSKQHTERTSFSG